MINVIIKEEIIKIDTDQIAEIEECERIYDQCTISTMR